MKRYSDERKSAVLKKLLPPMNMTVMEVAKQEGISDVTLYAWRKQVRAEGMAVPGAGKVPDDWSAEAKLAMVIETSGLSEIDFGAYCRGKGVYVEQVKAWRQAALDGQQKAQVVRQAERGQARQDQKRIKQLERELHRKERALAEAAALLILRKKAEAIWGREEED